MQAACLAAINRLDAPAGGDLEVQAEHRLPAGASTLLYWRGCRSPVACMNINILLLSLVPLRADHLGCYGYSRDTTPALDSIAAEGALFENAVSTGAWTPPAHASLLTGLYPSRHGVLGDGRLHDGVPTLAHLLGNAGYETVGFVNTHHMGAYKGLHRGFQEFHQIGTGGWQAQANRLLRHARRKGWLKKKKGTEATTRKVLSWLREHASCSRPFFMLVHYHELHHPYTPPRPYRYRYISRRAAGVDWRRLRAINANPHLYLSQEMSLTQDDFTVLRGLYDAELRYLDTQHIRPLFETLRELDLLDRTVVLVVSPHGENFGEHGLVSHVACLYEPLVHVPLILRYPAAVPAGLRVKSLVQLTDIVPTLLDLASIEPAALELQGASLLPLQEERMYRSYAVAEWGGGGFTRMDIAENDRLYRDRSDVFQRLTRKLTMLRVGDHKYIRGSDGSEELFNLASDPHELTNLAELEPQRTAQMARQLAAWQRSFEPPRTAPAPAAVEASLLEDLRAGGYRI